MLGYNATPISKPTGEVDFEQKCVVLFRELLKDPNVKPVGRRGQSQDGVDVVGHRNQDAHQLVGVQCKVKEEGHKLTETEVRGEVRKALKYRPALVEYVIVTTAKNDTKIQQLAQGLAQEQAKNGRRIVIDVWGWNTLQERINEFDSVREVFDPGFSPIAKKTREQLETVIAGQDKQATKKQVDDIAARLEEAVSNTRLPAVYADRELQQRLSRGLRRRGFGEADWTKESAQLAEQVIDGDLSLASVSLRADVLRRAARASADPKTINKARHFHATFEALAPNEGDRIFNALLADAEGDSDRALRLLRNESSKDANGAIFNILLRTRDTKQALDWIDSQKLKVTDFSPFGVINVFIKRIDAGQFERALEEISRLSDDDFRTCPVLHLLKANLIVASVMPADQKGWAFQGLPLDPRVLQPSSDRESRAKLKAARAEIGKVVALSDELQLKAIAEFLIELDLWLQLTDPDTAAQAQAAISKELGDPTKILRRVRLSLSYGIPVNVELLDKHLKERRKIGGWTEDERMAAFLLAYHSKEFSKIAAFFDEYREDLFAQEQLARAILGGIEVESLARAGRFDDARMRWAEHKERYFSDGQASDILELVNSIEKGDEVELLRKRYETSKQIADLRMLVHEFASKPDYRQLAHYAPHFVRETKQVEDLRWATRALYHEGRYSELLDLLDALPDVGAQDSEIKSLKAWSLFSLGRVMEARALARVLFTQRGESSDRELTINTAIESGDWGYLQGILAQELARIEALDAQTLLRMARLAFEVGSPYVDQFRDASLRRFPKNPEVFIAAYMLEVERGDEEHDSSKASEWFQKATKLSSSKGPVQSVGVKELVDRAPAWNKQVDKVEMALRLCQIPIFIAAQGLKRQPVDMFLGQAIRNASADKPRMQAPILAYSGMRPLVDLSGVARVALDISAILTLGYLGLLRETIDAFEVVVIAPTTLSTIFKERQFLRVHQPSEKAKAERLQKLLASKQLRVLPEVSASPTDLQNDIDGGLPELLRVAKQEKGLVVRSAPVHKLGSFMDETVDMAEFAAVLIDTHAILKFLSSAGKIDSKTKASAEAYLGYVDKGWSFDRAVDTASKLYLDELTVTYLDYVGLLEPLTRSVAAVYVESSVEERSKAVLRYATLTNDTLNSLERIRATLHLAIEQGKITLSARREQSVKRGKGREDFSAPSLEIMADLSKVELVVADDRYLNKDSHWTDGTRRVPTASSFSVLKTLNARAKLSQPAMWRARHELREAGYCLVPIEPDELLSYINTAPVNGGTVVETPELRAFRENMSLAQRAGTFLATEAPWLVATRFAIFQVIRAIWASGASENEAVAWSDWLFYTMSDPLAWCTNPAEESHWALACNQSATQAALLLCFFDGNRARRKHYAAWIDSRLVRRLSVNQPWLLEQALEFLKLYLARLLQEGKKMTPNDRIVMTELLLSPLPDSVRNEILRDDAFCSQISYKPQFVLPLGSVRARTDSLHKNLRAAVAKRRTGTLVLADGKKAKVRLGFQKPGTATLLLGKEGFTFADTDLLSGDKKVRCAGLERVFATRPLLAAEQESWRGIARSRAFTDREFVLLMTAVGATPESFSEGIRRPKKLNPGNLLSSEKDYYHRLTAPLGSAASFAEFIAGELTDKRRALLKQSKKFALRRISYSALARDLVPFDLLNGFKSSEFSDLLAANDPFSLLFAFEIAAARVKTEKRFESLGTRALEKLLGEERKAVSRSTIFSACAMISTVRLRAVFSEQEAPLFWFRLAAFSHAGVLADALAELSKPEEFLDWATKEVGTNLFWFTTVDRRDAPRWDIEWLSPDQIRAEVLGRVLIAMHGKKYPKKWDAIVDKATASLGPGNLLNPFFAGPMDDFTTPIIQKRRNPQLVKIERILKRTKSLDKLPNIAVLIYLERPSAGVAEGVRRLLDGERKRNRVLNEKERARLPLYAHLAASARSEALAREIINCCVWLARTQKLEARQVSDLLGASVIACGAVADHDKYGLLLADAATRMTYSVLNDRVSTQQVRLVCDALGNRDSKLIPCLSQAIAVAEAELLRQ